MRERLAVMIQLLCNVKAIIIVEMAFVGTLCTTYSDSRLVRAWYTLTWFIILLVAEYCFGLNVHTNLPQLHTHTFKLGLFMNFFLIYFNSNLLIRYVLAWLVGHLVIGWPSRDWLQLPSDSAWDLTTEEWMNDWVRQLDRSKSFDYIFEWILWGFHASQTGLYRD